MVGVLVIPLDNVRRFDTTVGWTAANEHDHLKYQAVHIVPSWEAKIMAAYAKLKACCLYRKFWSRIKAYDAQKDIQQVTIKLRENYEDASEVNKRVT